jgi:hypothetical protein
MSSPSSITTHIRLINLFCQSQIIIIDYVDYVKSGIQNKKNIYLSPNWMIQC